LMTYKKFVCMIITGEYVYFQRLLGLDYHYTLKQGCRGQSVYPSQDAQPCVLIHILLVVLSDIQIYLLCGGSGCVEN